MADHWKDRELQEFGTLVIDKYHEDKMDKAVFDFVFCDPPAKKGGKVVAGTARKVPKLWKDIGSTEADFLITISKEVWDAVPPPVREAIVDHELSHCEIEAKNDGSYKFVMVEHDLNEFIEIYKRHGAYMEDLEQFVVCAKEREENKDE